MCVPVYVLVHACACVYIISLNFLCRFQPSEAVNALQCYPQACFCTSDNVTVNKKL